MELDQDYFWDLHEGDFWHKNKDRVLMKFIDGKEVLDVAAGTGSFSIKLAKEGKNVTYIDYSKKYYEIAKKRGKTLPITFLCTDITKHEFKKKFDCVVLSAFLEHVKDDSELLNKIHNILKPGGKIVLLTSAYQWLYSNFDKNVGHYRRYNKSELQGQMQKAGFKVNVLKYWDLIGLPVLIVSRFFGKMIITSKMLNNNLLDKMLDKWFRFFENHMLTPGGLNLIAVGEKQKNDV